MPFNWVQASLNLFITFAAMIILDYYLVQQNSGRKKTGVLVLLVVEEFCHLFVLKYLLPCLNSRLHTTNRGYATVSWFLFVITYEVKLYLVLQNLWGVCASPPPPPPTTTMPQGTEENRNSLVSNSSHHDSKDPACDYSLITRKVLTLSQAVLIPSLFLLLVGEQFLVGKLKVQELSRMKLQTFWAVIDILDLIQLQSINWEEVAVDSSYQLAICGYFYSYIALVVIPSLSLAEMSKSRNKNFSLRFSLPLIVRVTLINIGTSVVRFLFIFVQKNSYTSSIFIGKNFICFYLQVCNINRKIHMSGDTDEVQLNEMDRNQKSPNGVAGVVASSANSLLLHEQSASGQVFSNDLSRCADGEEKRNSRLSKSKIYDAPSFEEEPTGSTLTREANNQFILFHNNDDFFSVEREFETTSQSGQSNHETETFCSYTCNELGQSQDSGLLFTPSLSSPTTTYSSEQNNSCSNNDFSAPQLRSHTLYPPPPAYTTNIPEPDVTCATESIANLMQSGDTNLKAPFDSANALTSSPAPSSYSVSTVIDCNGIPQDKESLVKDTDLLLQNDGHLSKSVDESVGEIS